MKRFIEIVREDKRLRKEPKRKMAEVNSSFVMAMAEMSTKIEEALMYPKRKIELEASSRNIMSVDVPILEFVIEMGSEGDVFPYGFANTSGELDRAITALSELAPTLLKLAELEKSAQLLADEIEKTRRRINALEYVLIPNLEETVKYIVMKLEENERGNLTRLMKVKDMMLEQAHGYKNK
jgi:V/A-type H+-transporting ATPase subunit D